MKLLYYTGWLTFRTISKVIFRIRISGKENIPKSGGFILASNHISYYDPPLVGSWSTRQMYFFAKAELFKNKLFGAIIRRTNAIPVRRGVIDRQAIELAAAAIERGYGLVVFPEGTRARDGNFLKPKAGLGMLALRTGCPIVPAYVSGADRLKSCFWGQARLSITFGKMLESSWIDTFTQSKEGYEAISRAVMERIAGIRAESELHARTKQVSGQ